MRTRGRSQLWLAAVGWPGSEPSMTLVAGTSMLTCAMSLFLPQRLVTGSGPDETRLRSLLRWALAESATVTGLVATLIGGPRWLVVAGAAWALGLLLFAAPDQGTRSND